MRVPRPRPSRRDGDDPTHRGGGPEVPPSGVDDAVLKWERHPEVPFLLLGFPEPRSVTPRGEPHACQRCRWQLWFCTVRAVAQPNRSLAFTAPSRTQVVPIRNPLPDDPAGGLMVETAGIEPAS